MITYGYCYLLVIPYYSLKAIFLCRIICTNFTNFGPCFWNPNYSWCFRNPKDTHLGWWSKNPCKSWEKNYLSTSPILVNHGKKTTNLNLTWWRLVVLFATSVAKWQELATKLSPKTGPWSINRAPGGWSFEFQLVLWLTRGVSPVYVAKTIYHIY